MQRETTQLVEILNQIQSRLDQACQNEKGQQSVQIKQVILMMKQVHDQVCAKERLSPMLPVVKLLATLFFSIMRGEIKFEDKIIALLEKSIHVLCLSSIKLEGADSTNANYDGATKLLKSVHRAIGLLLNTQNSRKIFLQDPDHYFQSLEKMLHTLAIQQEHFLNNKESIHEFFRIIHTIKGNASAFGFDVITKQAHLIESLVQRVLDSDDSRNNLGTSHYLIRACESMLASYQNEFIEEFDNTLLQENSNVEYFLFVKMGKKRMLIPCENISEVMPMPLVLTVPGAPSEWKGIIRSGTGFIPLLKSDFEARDNEQHYVVVLQYHGFTGFHSSGKFSIPVTKIEEVKQIQLDDLEGISNILSISDFATKLGAA